MRIVLFNPMNQNTLCIIMGSLALILALVLCWISDRRKLKADAEHMARVAEIEAKWRAMPKRSSNGRFAKK